MTRITEGLFPDGVAVAEASTEMEQAPLFPEEEQAVRSAVEKRRREFQAGRACARAALAALGIPPVPIPVGLDRAPVWPDGVVGSITHTGGLCAAAVCRRGAVIGIGLDLERSGAVGESLLNRICVDSEIAWIERTPPPPSGDWPTLLFSAKESVYKALRAQAGPSLGFRDAAVRAGPEAGGLRAEIVAPGLRERIPQPLRGRFALSRRYVVTAFLLRASDWRPAGA